MGNVVSEFYGMTVLMSLDPVDPRPHIEVLHEGKISKFDLSTGRFYAGELVQDGQEIVREWFQKYRRQLLRNWELLQDNKPIQPIPAIL